MIKPEDLNQRQRESYDLWRRLGLSEFSAMNALVEDGLLRASEHDQLVVTFRELGCRSRRRRPQLMAVSGRRLRGRYRKVAGRRGDRRRAMP